MTRSRTQLTVVNEKRFLLYWREYKYFPYERQFALREVKSLINPQGIKKCKTHLDLAGEFNENKIRRLTYFSKAVDRRRTVLTTQTMLEQSHHINNGGAKKRQATRYSVHGLHEYKGKFNPQVVKTILNMLNIDEGSHIYDPFCGSGTTLVECTHLGIPAAGTDMNPLATFVANAKLMALSVAPTTLRKASVSILESYKEEKSKAKTTMIKTDDSRLHYLSRWFPSKILRDIEAFYRAAVSEGKSLAPIFLAIASNLLREYSLQEPADLRIRRRRSPFPIKPFMESYVASFDLFLNNLSATQAIIGSKPRSSVAYTFDSRKLNNEPYEWKIKPPFNCIITSPPYATALPYIDTQRLSLMWLRLVNVSKLRSLEAELIGSREVWGIKKEEMLDNMCNNSEHIPSELAEYCLELRNALSKKDGFRRQAVPYLLYRYFADMRKVFRALIPHVSKKAPFALIVGHNHTVLGGRRFDIDTPSYLVVLADDVGWLHEESIPMQTYQRYGLHMNNAVASENLIVLRRA